MTNYHANDTCQEDGDRGTTFLLNLHICSYLICDISDCVNQNKSDIIRTDKDPGLQIERFAIIKLRGVTTKFEK